MNDLKKRYEKEIIKRRSLITLTALCLVLTILLIGSATVVAAAISLDKSSFEVNELISGNLMIPLKGGELLPSDSVLEVSVNGQTNSYSEEVLLQELLNLEVKNGERFYNGGSYGIGEGIGYEGELVLHPDVSFRLELMPEQVGDFPAALIEVEGVASFDENFVYDLGEFNGSVNIVTGSVKTDIEELSNDAIDVNINENQLTVSTDYEKVILGFGEDFLGEEIGLEIDLGNLDLKLLEDEYVIRLTLKYNEVGLFSEAASFNVSVPGMPIVPPGEEELPPEDVPEEVPEEVPGEESGEGDPEDQLIDQPSVEPSPEVEEPESAPFMPIIPTPAPIMDVRIDETVVQGFAEINKPVFWTKNYKLEEKRAGLRVKVPQKAYNLSIKKKVKEITPDLGIHTVSTVDVDQVTREGFVGGITGGVIGVGLQEDNRLLSRIIWWMVDFISNLGKMTGLAVGDVGVPNAEVEYIIQDEVEEVEVTYWTPGPEVSERVVSDRKKEVTISSDVHYTNILTYTSLEEFPEERIKLYRTTDGVREETEIIEYIDSNENGLIDEVKWITPSLSEQTYVVEISVLNVQSYPTINGNWTVRFTTSGAENLTIQGFSGTSFTDDLEFLELKCGDEILNADYDGERVFYENYSCDDFEGRETSKVVTYGKHNLMFTFGDEVAYAYNDVISYEENYAWRNLTDANSPSLRAMPFFSYDSGNELFVMFGGDISGIGSQINETWTFDLPTNTWTQKYPVDSPSPRAWGNAMAYDSANEMTLLFGGYYLGSKYDETWAYNSTANNWVNMSPPTNPGAYSQHAVTYDSERDLLILFGGAAPGLMAETWAYNYTNNSWSNRAPAASPTARVSHDIAFDSKNGVVVLWGGNTGSAVDDTWTYDFDANTWTNKNPDNKPAARQMYNLEFDSKNNVTIMFGGQGTTGLNETWAYDYLENDWVEWDTSNNPPGRSLAGMAYDSVNNEMVVVGGVSVYYSNIKNDVWALNHSSVTTVLNYAPTHSSPVINSTTGADFSSENITCYPQDLADADDDGVYPIFNWYKDDVPIAVLNMPFDSENNTVAKDYSGIGNSGTINGGASWNSSGVVGGAYELDGDGDYILVSDADSLSALNNELTIEAWIKPASFVSHMKIISKDDGLQDREYQMYIPESTGLIGFVLLEPNGNNAISFTTSSGVSLDQWVHVVGTYNGSTANLYLDGILNTSSSMNSPSLGNTDTPVAIGRDPTSATNYFNGSIDEVKIYNYPLSASQIYQNYVDGLNVVNTSTIVSGETSVGETWKCEVTPNDATEDGNSLNASLLVEGFVSTGIPILNSTYGTNYIHENLTCYEQSTTGTGATSVYNWYKDDVSLMVLNMPFDVNISSTTTDAVKDYSSLNNDGTLGGGTAGYVPLWNSSGVVGGRYDFDGVDDYIDSNSNTLIQGTGPWTIESWIKTDDVSSSMFISTATTYSGPPDVDIGLQLTVESGKAVGRINQASAWKSVTSDTNVDDNTWHHIVFIRSAASGAGSLRLYFDGVEEGTPLDAGSYDITTSNTLKIGAEGALRSEYRFNGSIDEVRIYNLSLSASQVYQLYQDTKDGLTSEKTIVSDETDSGDVWSCKVTPVNGSGYGAEKESLSLDLVNATCYAPASGNWFIDCSSYCNWTTNQTVVGNITIYNAGTLNLSASWNFTETDQYIEIEDSCEIDIYSGGGFNVGY